MIAQPVQPGLRILGNPRFGRHPGNERYERVSGVRRRFYDGGDDAAELRVGAFRGCIGGQCAGHELAGRGGDGQANSRIGVGRQRGQPLDGRRGIIAPFAG